MKNIRALVTGGCGFIGSNLAKKLTELGWRVDVVDDMSNGHLSLLEGEDIKVLPNASFIIPFNEQTSNQQDRKDNTILVIQDDFASPYLIDYIEQDKYDFIFHQAAVPRVSYSVEQPAETTDVNISKTVSIMKAAAGHVKKFIFASSSSVYGGAEDLPTSEASAKNPKSPYAWQKSAIEDFAKIAWDLYYLDVVCLRYFNVFGPGQYGDSPYATAVSSWCHAASEKLACRSDGDGTQSRDMCYVDNVVSANILAATADRTFKGKCYNIACGDRTTNHEILEYFKDNFDVMIKHAPWRPGDVMHTQANVSEARKDFGYEPIVRFWEGLERTIEWWGLKDG